MGLEENKADRQEAEQLVHLLGEKRPRFWESLAELARGKLGTEPAMTPMTETQARSFETTLIKYGRYAGQEVASVPGSYLLWMVEGDAFTKKLKAYVASERFAKRQEMEAESH